MNLETQSPLPDSDGEPIGGTPAKLPSLAKGKRVKQPPTEALAEIQSFYTRTRSERRPHEIKWFVNAAYVRGEQMGRWNNITSQLEATQTPSHRVKRAINLILPKVKAKLAKFVKSRPMPIIIPASSNREAVMNAKATEKVLAYLWRKLGLETKYEDAIMWAMITGKSYWWFHWNPSAIGQIKEPDGPNGPGQILDVPMGDIMVEGGTAFEFLPEDVGISRLQDQHRIMRVKVRDCSEVEARWDLEKGTLKGDTSSGDLFQFAKQIANLGARGVTGYGTDDKKDEGAQDKIIVKELFTRPCTAYPKGRYQVAAGDTLLKDEDELPYDFGQDTSNPFPCVEFADMLSPGQYWPTTMVEQMIGPQTEYNTIRNKVEEQFKLQAHPKLFVWKQANLAPNAYNSEAGEKIEGHFIPGMPPPFFLHPPSIAADAWKEIELIKIELDDITNIRPADVGNVNNGGESGFQTNLLQEASDSVHAPDIRRNELSIEEASFKMRRLAAMGYTIPRLISIAGKNHAADVFEFSQDQIDEHADVIVQAGSALPTLKAARTKMIMEMHGAQLFGDPADPSVKRRVLGMLEVGGTESAIDTIRRDDDMSRQENLEVSKHKPVNAPMPWENHQIHYENHSDQLKSPDMYDWSGEQRDELIRHLILHAKFINPQNALMLAQQFGFQDLVKIIQPLLPPPGPPPGQAAPPAPTGPSPEELASKKEIAIIGAQAKIQTSDIESRRRAEAAITVAELGAKVQNMELFMAERERIGVQEQGQQQLQQDDQHKQLDLQEAAQDRQHQLQQGAQDHMQGLQQSAQEHEQALQIQNQQAATAWRDTQAKTDASTNIAQMGVEQNHIKTLLTHRAQQDRLDHDARTAHAEQIGQEQDRAQNKLADKKADIAHKAADKSAKRATDK